MLGGTVEGAGRPSVEQSDERLRIQMSNGRSPWSHHAEQPVGKRIRDGPGSLE
ncbi:hypothetical protein STRIP9103_02068 [Streptomyces ipomoeae 91-03]|uniref:Uncharacterized protein n=1 Tax=Streptomyces ipomoeae 91-03 TaxID=698759 RepID=L1KV53_9ACTN|nr:hypothetical protein STRIP9103_02068 [Streptomyces ipomoeae 91-03]